MAKRKFTEKEQKIIIELYTSDKVHTIAALAKINKCSRGMIRHLLITKQVIIRLQAEAQTRKFIIDERDQKRFLEKINICGKNNCWEWLANIDSCGYGRFGFRNKLLSAHRFAWKLFFGGIPEKMQVLHACDNPPCCNPFHLFLGTHQDNMTDRNNKGRSRGGSNKGEAHPSSIFTNSNILEIRKMLKDGNKQKDIAILFKTTQPVISAIKLRKYWKHI